MKKMLIFLSSLFLMFSFVACNNHHNLPALEECPYEMKGPLTIQDPFVDSTTYTVTVPKETLPGVLEVIPFMLNHLIMWMIAMLLLICFR